MPTTNVEIDSLVHSGEEASVLEVVVRGAHADGVAPQIRSRVVALLEEHRPNILVINFLGFDYEVGDDLGGALLLCHVALRGLGGPHAYRIVAMDSTARSLALLFDRVGIVELVGGEIFTSVDSAVGHARSALAEAPE